MLPVPARFAVTGFGLAVGACALVLVGGASAQGATTLTFKELTNGSTFVFVDNAPASKTNGEPAASAGDVIVFTNPLVDGATDPAPLHALHRRRRVGGEQGPFAWGIVGLGGGR